MESDLSLKKLKFMAHIIYMYMHFQNVFVTLQHYIAKDVTSLLLSWHKRNDFNADKFST